LFCFPFSLRFVFVLFCFVFVLFFLLGDTWSRDVGRALGKVVLPCPAPWSWAGPELMRAADSAPGRTAR
jgi:hypothetical protein